MRALLIVAVLVFVALPYDGQLWLLGLVRDVWLTPMGQAFLVGLLGATAGALVWYNIIWNALAYRIYLDDVAKAEDTYRRRRR